MMGNCKSKTGLNVNKRKKQIKTASKLISPFAGKNNILKKQRRKRWKIRFFELETFG